MVITLVGTRMINTRADDIPIELLITELMMENQGENSAVIGALFGPDASSVLSFSSSVDIAAMRFSFSLQPGSTYLGLPITLSGTGVFNAAADQWDAVSSGTLGTTSWTVSGGYFGPVTGDPILPPSNFIINPGSSQFHDLHDLVFVDPATGESGGIMHFTDRNGNRSTPNFPITDHRNPDGTWEWNVIADAFRVSSVGSSPVGSGGPGSFSARISAVPEGSSTLPRLAASLSCLLACGWRCQRAMVLTGLTNSQPTIGRERRRICRMDGGNSFQMCLRIPLAALVALTLVILPSTASAISITIGGVNIADNGPRDSNLGVNVIDFDSTTPGAAGFPLATGYEVKGRVTLGGGGALAGVGAASIVNLTSFEVFRPVGAAGGALPVAFDHTFAAPPAPVFGADGIFGLFSHIDVSFFGNDPNVGAGDQVTFHGAVNGTFITPPAVPFVATSGAGGPPPIGFRGGHGPTPPLGGGPPWTLLGVLTVELTKDGDVLSLPSSAEVGISPEILTPTPESGNTFTAFALAIVSLGAVRLCLVTKSRNFSEFFSKSP